MGVVNTKFLFFCFWDLFGIWDFLIPFREIKGKDYFPNIMKQTSSKRVLWKFFSPVSVRAISFAKNPIVKLCSKRLSRLNFSRKDWSTSLNIWRDKIKEFIVFKPSRFTAISGSVTSWYKQKNSELTILRICEVIAASLEMIFPISSRVEFGDFSFSIRSWYIECILGIVSIEQAISLGFYSGGVYLEQLLLQWCFSIFLYHMVYSNICE